MNLGNGPSVAEKRFTVAFAIELSRDSTLAYCSRQSPTVQRHSMTEQLEWVRLYRSALRETDLAKQQARMEEAKRVMKQALRLAVEYEDSDQRHAISEALSHLENIQRR
jgi:hypothetical protein